MRRTALVSAATIVALLATTTVPASAQNAAATQAPLRASIDREAAKAAAQPALPARQKTPVRSKRMQGGGGGGGMIVMTVIGTVASLAATYFVVKEMRKRTDEANQQQ